MRFLSSFLWSIPRDVFGFPNIFRKTSFSCLRSTSNFFEIIKLIISNILTFDYFHYTDVWLFPIYWRLTIFIKLTFDYFHYTDVWPFSLFWRLIIFIMLTFDYFHTQTAQWNFLHGSLLLIPRHFCNIYFEIPNIFFKKLILW